MSVLSTKVVVPAGTLAISTKVRPVAAQAPSARLMRKVSSLSEASPHVSVALPGAASARLGAKHVSTSAMVRSFFTVILPYGVGVGVGAGGTGPVVVWPVGILGGTLG